VLIEAIHRRKTETEKARIVEEQSEAKKERARIVKEKKVGLTCL
jgi:large subunit ribosomal protein L19e